MRETVSCMDCGIPYSEMGLDLVLPDQQWRVLVPEGGIVCANCICKRAERIGGTVVLAWIDNVNYDEHKVRRTPHVADND